MQPFGSILARLAAALAGAVLFASFAGAQYPGQYPPGQYPGGYPPSYPGGTYPPGSYPPGSYPTPIPGVNLPQPRLPGRKDKGSENQSAAKVTVASVEGRLRKLAEKDLLLETSKKNVLRFRLIRKTEFRDKKGEAIRDSLLQPGDELSVDVSPDDEETALFVVLMRSGSAGDRTAAGKPVDEAVVRAPESSDFGKPHSVAAGHGAPDSSAPASSAPESSATSDSAPSTDAPATRGASASTETPASSEAPAEPVAPPAPKTPHDPKLDTDERILSDARAAAGEYSSKLPNFLAQQVTSRFYAAGFPSQWVPIDVVTADVAYVNGKEDYRNFRVNDVPVNAPPERSGSWSTGEFGTTLEDLLSMATNASFKRRGEERIAGVQTVVFDYTVAATNSHWTMVAPDGREYRPSYHGAIWVDKESRRVMKLEQKTTDFPTDSPFSMAQCTLQYGFLKIDANFYLLPASSEMVGCVSGAGSCTKNALVFKNYKKFTSDSKITFDK